MWENIGNEFSRIPSQAEVAKYMLEAGICQAGNKLYFGKVAISHSQLAEALGKDKRLVTATVKTILANKKLYKIFSRLQPTCNLIDIAPMMGWDVLGIEIDVPNKPGTIGNVTKLLGDMGISIRQAQCPATSRGLLYIIAENSIDGRIIDELKTVPNIRSIKIMK